MPHLFGGSFGLRIGPKSLSALFAFGRFVPYSAARGLRPIVEEMKNEPLPDNPAFFRLSPEERNRLMEAAELWEAPEGAFVHYPGDPGEDMLFILEGRLEERTDGINGDGRARRWFPGDLWGVSHPFHPESSAAALVAAEFTRWLRWTGPSFRSLLESDAGLRKALSPLRDEDGVLISGLPDGPDAGGEIRRRRFRPSVKPALIGLAWTAVVGVMLVWAVGVLEGMPLQIPLAAPAAFIGWFLVFLIRRALTEYTMDSDSVISRSFDWGRLSIISRHVPIDGVQGVETEKNGWARRLLDYGTVIVKTSAMEGELKLIDVNSPEDIAQTIRSSKRNVSERNIGRERMEMRRILESGGTASAVPKKIRSSLGPAGKDAPASGSETRIRKSPAVLLFRLSLPLLAAAGILLFMKFAGTRIEVDPRLVFTAGLACLIWAIYRFEDWRNDSFRISGGYVIDLYRKPLGLKETRRQVDLVSVQNIRTEQKGFASFLFRYGNVVLVTAGGASDTVLTGVSKPWRIQEILFRRREEEIRRREYCERNRAKDDLARFAEAMEQIRMRTVSPS